MDINSTTREYIIYFVFYLIALSFLIFFGIYFGLNSPIWIDEIFTYYHSTGGNLCDFNSQTESGINRMPPFYFLLNKLLFNENTFVIYSRILSIIFSTITFLYLFKICKFWLDWSVSFFLTTLTLFSSDLFLQYSFEARPYSLCLMLHTIFCFLILKHEHKSHLRLFDYFTLGMTCFMLPTSHYTYGLTALVLGLTHILFSQKNKLRIFITYLTAGILFIIIHLKIFLNQQKFSNILAMIDYPSKENLLDYLLLFFPTSSTLLILLSFLILGAYKHNFYLSRNITKVKIICFLGISLIGIIIVGILLAREFPNNIWFLPRYYLGGILIIAFATIPMYSTLKISKIRTKAIIIIVSLTFICLNLYSFKSNRVYLYNNPQKFCYAYYPDKELKKYSLPIVTDDPVLYFHYLYQGIDINFLIKNKNDKKSFQQFLPNFKEFIIDEISFSSMIFLSVKDRNQFSKSNQFSSKELKIEISPIHSAYLIKEL